jgi:hypothetical protein
MDATRLILSISTIPEVRNQGMVETGEMRYMSSIRVGLQGIRFVAGMQRIFFAVRTFSIHTGPKPWGPKNLRQYLVCLFCNVFKF